MIDEALYQEYQSKIIAGDRGRCVEIVKELLESEIQLKELYIQLFQRSLYEVGRLWETNKISVAVEHLCTSITESLINLVYPYMFAAEHSGKKAVITCTPGEYHQIGARMLADYFELKGWDSYFLGSNTPVTGLVKFIEECHPDLLAVSMSVYFNLNSLHTLVKSVCEYFPDLEIIVGGQAFNWGGADSLKSFTRVTYISSLDDLDDKILNPKQNAGRS
jgi:MerR family transcriptional regulator, light-induced transcriptional regulator